MIVTTRIPAGPNFLGYGRRPMRRPMAHYRGYRDIDAGDLLDTAIGTLPGLIQGGVAIANSVTGANRTGTSVQPTITPSQSNPSGVGSGGYMPMSGSSGVPSWVWIAGGLVIVGGAAFLLLK